MPVPADRDLVQELIATRDSQVVEVLPRPEYDWAHLAGATHLWLRDMDAATVAERLDPARPVVVYCNDFQCDMSPRAACRLERFGFSDVYDYVAGKMDWLSFALPHDGQALLTGDVARREVPTCGPEETVGALRARLEKARASFCVAISADGVVLGVLQDGLDQAAADATAEEIMDFGITTVRPAEEVGPLLERMRNAGVEAILLTRSDGTLYGLLEQAEAEAALAGR